MAFTIRVTRLDDFSPIGLLSEADCDFIWKKSPKKWENFRQNLAIFFTISLKQTVSKH